jgi:pimeloyl-ACP methyl ester carboxylesterase
VSDGRRITARGIDTFYYDRGHGDEPIICLHGNPDSADAWTPLLDATDRLGRVIAPDLPCFGRSARVGPPAFDASLDAYIDWFEAFLDALAINRYRLVVHDWGSLALVAAARRPEQVTGIVAINTVPLSAAYRWHWIARLLWRPRVVAALDADLLDRFQRDLDPGMKRAILRLYRSADSAELGRQGAQLGALRCPALIVWGEQDPYVGAAEMDVLAKALGGPVDTRRVAGGHWPMCDTDEVFDLTRAFLTRR